VGTSAKRWLTGCNADVGRNAAIAFAVELSTCALFATPAVPIAKPL
jgi:hypothetical protein